MYTPKIRTYNKQRDKLVRKVLRELEADNGWEVVHEIREGNTIRPIYRIR